MNFTPGISFNVVSISDQKYRNIENIKKLICLILL